MYDPVPERDRGLAAIRVPELSQLLSPLVCNCLGFDQFLCLSEVAHVVGQGTVGLFRYPAESLSNPAPATGIRWLLLNSQGHRCEGVYELCKAILAK